MVSLQSIDHLGFSSKQFQSCNKSLINQACSGPSSVGEYQPLVFICTDLAALGPYCQDLRPIFSQYSPRAWLMRYIYLGFQTPYTIYHFLLQFWNIYYHNATQLRFLKSLVFRQEHEKFIVTTPALLVKRLATFSRPSWLSEAPKLAARYVMWANFSNRRHHFKRTNLLDVFFVRSDFLPSFFLPQIFLVQI